MCRTDGYLCDITCGEQCNRCEDPTNHRYGWTSAWNNDTLTLDRSIAEAAQLFQVKGFDVEEIRRWTTAKMSSKDVRSLSATLASVEPGTDVLKDFRNYFRAGVDSTLHDDVINVGGHRLGTKELESASLTVEEVSEAAAVPVIDETRARAVKMYVSLKKGPQPSRTVKDKVTATIEHEIGKIARPVHVWIVPDMPKTRSGKIMRRVIAAISNFADGGDVSHAGEPGDRGRHQAKRPERETRARRGPAPADARRRSPKSARSAAPRNSGSGPRPRRVSVSERDVAVGAASGGGGGQCFGQAAAIGGVDDFVDQPMAMARSTPPAMRSC